LADHETSHFYPQSDLDDDFRRQSFNNCPFYWPQPF